MPMAARAVANKSLAAGTATMAIFRLRPLSSPLRHICRETLGGAVLERCIQRKATLPMEVHTMLSGECDLGL